MRISRASTYAIGALLQLVDAPIGVPVPCSRLAKSGEMPERFLLQVLRSLVNSELLTSTRGIDGGYSLARPAKEISLLQILEATDGPISPELPPLDCIPRSAQLHLQEIYRQIAADTCGHLAKVSLADLPRVSASEEVPMPESLIRPESD